MSTSDYVEECNELGKQIEEYLNHIKYANREDRQDLIKKIKAKISIARDYLMIIQMDALDTSNYKEYEKCINKISKLEQQFQSLLDDHEKASEQSLSANDLLNLSQRIHDSQLNCY